MFDFTFITCPFNQDLTFLLFKILRQVIFLQWNILKTSYRMTYFAIKNEYGCDWGVIQCISGRNVVYCDPMNNVCFQQSLYRPVKRDPVIHIAHFFLDITFCQREPLVKQNRNNGYSLGALF